MHVLSEIAIAQKLVHILSFENVYTMDLTKLCNLNYDILYNVLRRF